MWVVPRRQIKRYSPKFFDLIGRRLSRVDCLHAKHLVATLFVIEHGRSKIVEDIFHC